jgi:hypothetical protein
MLLLWYLPLLQLLLPQRLLPALCQCLPLPLQLVVLLLTIDGSQPRHNGLEWAQLGEGCLDFWTCGFFHMYCPSICTVIVRQYCCTCRGWSVLLQ